MSPSLQTMGFFMSDINFCNTKEQLNHLGEVVTGKVDGSPTGADIDTSTLPYTGQVRKTLPALEGEYEQSITDKEVEADAAIDSYRLLNKGPYASGITLESKFEYITYNGESYFATNPPYTTTATLPDADANLFLGGYTTFENVANKIGNKNELSNSNFLIQSPDNITHPNATPESYVAGTQIFSGVYAGDIGCTITFIDGRVNCTAGDYKFKLPNTGGLERVPAFTSSISDYDGVPKTTGVSHALVGDEYVVTVTPAAGDVFSVKIEQGSAATRHETEYAVISTGSTTPRTLEERFTDILNVKDNGGGENSSKSGWEDSSALVKSKASSNNTLTEDELNLGNKSIKLWKKASGIKDSAVAASFSLGDETEPKTQVTGVDSPSELASYSNRDCVAVFAQNLSRPARFESSNTVFTSTSVVITNLPGGLFEGMLIDVNQGGSPWYTSRIESISGDTIQVLAWYEVGTSNQGIPSNGDEVKVDSYTKIWAHNANIEIKTDGEANSGTGFELGLLCQKAGSGANTGGFDVVVLDGERPQYGYRARAGSGLSLLYGFMASQNVEIGVSLKNNSIGLEIEDASSTAIVVKKDGNSRFKIDENGRQSGTYYPVQLASTSTTVSVDSVYTIAISPGITLTAPSASSAGAGKVMYFVNKSGGNITTIDQGTSILSDGLTRKILSDGANWLRIESE